MADKMRFTPELIEVREGETVKLVDRNGGKVLHEFVLGTKAGTRGARRHDGQVSEHGTRRALHGPCRAGKKGEIVWIFNRPASSTSPA